MQKPSPSGRETTARPSIRTHVHGWFITTSNRPRKWVVILVSLYAAYCLLFGLLLPRALHGIATTTLSRSLNADCSLDRITYNPFTFTLGVHGLRIPYPDGNGVFLTVESIELAPGFSTFLRLAPALGHLSIVRPAFDVTLYADGRSSPLQFVTENAQPPDAPEKPSSPFPFILSNLEVIDGSVVFRDEMHGTTHTVEHLTIEVPFASTLRQDSTRPMRPVLNATINGKFMSLEGRITPFAETQRSEFRLFVGALPLAYFQPYLTPYTSLILEKGTITTEAVLHFSRTDEALDIGLSGRLALDGIVLGAPGEGPIFSLEHGSVTLEHLLLDLEELSIEEVLLQNPTITLTKEKTGEFNWQRYMRPAPRAAAPKTAPPATNGTFPATANGTASLQSSGVIPPTARADDPAHNNATSASPAADNATRSKTANATVPAAGNALLSGTALPAGNATQTAANASQTATNATQAAANATRSTVQPAQVPKEKAARQGLPAVSLKHLSLLNGHVVWLDAGVSGAAPVDIAPINLEIRDASTEGAGRGAFSLTVGDQTIAAPALTAEFFQQQVLGAQAIKERAANSTATAATAATMNGTAPTNATLPAANGTLGGNAQANGTLPAANGTLPSGNATLGVTSGVPTEALPPKRPASPLGDMALRGTLTLTPLRVAVQVQIQALPLTLSAPYLKEANLTLNGGQITADTRLLLEQGKEGFLFSMTEGAIALRSFAGSTSLPSGGNAVMKVTTLSLEKLAYDLAARAMRIGTITLDAPEIQVTMAGMEGAASGQTSSPAAQKAAATAAPAVAAGKAPPPKKAQAKKPAPAVAPAEAASAGSPSAPSPTAAAPAKKASPAQNGTPASTTAPVFSFALDRFHMTKGTVNIINPAAPRSPLSLAGMELVLTDFAAQPGKTVQISSSATWNGSGKASTTGKGTLTPLNLTLTTVLNNIPLASVAPWLRQVSLLTVASGTFSCDITTQIADAGIAVKADTTPAQKAASQAARAKAIKDSGAPAPSPADRPARPEQTAAAASNAIGVAIGGKASIDNLSLRDGPQEILSLASMRLFGIRVNTAARTYDIGGLVLQNPRIFLTLLPEGMNSFTRAFDVTGEKTRQARLASQARQAQRATSGGLEQALQEAQSSGQPVAQPGQTTASTAPHSVRVEPLLPDIARFTLGTLGVQNGLFRMQDQTLPRKSTVTLSALNFKMTGISSEAGSKADISLSGTLEGAPLTVAGTASPLFTPLQGALDITLADMDLIPLSPYAEKFIAYPIESGALSLTANVQTDGIQLNAGNEISLKKLTLGEKMNFKGAPNLPVKLGLSLLADSNGIVTLSLPVAGRLDDPNFRIGGVVAKVLGNVLLKVATSPFSLLGAVVGGVTGGSEPALQYVPFAPGDARVSEAALKTIRDVITLLQKRPRVTLVLQGVADEGEREKLAGAFIRQGVQGLKWESLSNKEQKTTRPTELEVDPATNAEEYAHLLFDFYADQPFPKPKTLGITKKQPVEEMIRMITAAVPTTDAALEALAQKRAEAVRQEILTLAPALADRVSVAPAPKVREAAKGQALMSRVELGVK